MLRLLFTTKDNSNQLTVTTDGIDGQLNIFVTENVTGNVDYFKSLGIVIEPGYTYNIGKFKEWASENDLILISYPEGLNDQSQVLVDFIEETRYFLTVKEESLSFVATGESKQAIVTSYKELYVNGEPSGEQTPISVLFETASPFSVSEGGLVTVSENLTDQVRNGNLKITQAESGKIMNVSLTQEASIIEYNYNLTATPENLSFVNTGEFKTVDVTCTKQKIINDKPSGSPIKVNFDVEIVGVGFSYEIISGGINVTASENPGTSERTGTLNVSSQESSDTVSINLSQEASVITYEYTFKSPDFDPDEILPKVNFPNEGGTENITIVSQKQKKINGKLSGDLIEVNYDIRNIDDIPFTIDRLENGIKISALTNPEEEERSATINLFQTESKTVILINIIQAGGTVTYEYLISTDPTTLSFVSGGETKTFGVSSTKQKKINGVNSGDPIAIDYTTTVNGEGFSKGTTEYSVIAAENTGGERTGSAVVTMNEGDKSATITLTQTAHSNGPEIEP